MLLFPRAFYKGIPVASDSSQMYSLVIVSRLAGGFKDFIRSGLSYFLN